MSEKVKKDGYQPLHEGYQPSDQRGHQPKEPQGSKQITPPKGGSGEVKPSSDKSGKK